MMKSAFYFMLKAFFVLEIFIFLSKLFGSVEKRLHNKAVDKKQCQYDVTNWPKIMSINYCPISQEVKTN